MLPWRILQVTCAVLLTSQFDVVEAKCPWRESGLALWSDPTTWDDNQVPAVNAEVVVTKRVLMDVQPPSLATITIQAGAALIWGNYDDLLMNVSFINVLGEFHIGSENCRFKKKATINLYGRTDSPYEDAMFGRKFIGVAEGGVLEIHGNEKTSWTKLAHTVPAADSIDCAKLYDHTSSPLGKEKRSGLNVIAWNPDGSVRDFAVFVSSDYHTLPQFLHGLPPGTIVAAAVYKTAGDITEDVFTSLEALGATMVREVIELTPYAFIAIVGDVTSAREQLRTNDYARIIDFSTNLEYRAASLVRYADFQVINAEVTTPKITLSHDVSSWEFGDEILVTSTDFDWRQAEVKKVDKCPDCLPNQIRLDTPFQYMHYGEVTMNVDERAEVALLSRNILIQGQLQDRCYISNAHDRWICSLFDRDMFGGHVQARKGSTIHVEGAELFQMGQQNVLGSYPLHFHMMEDASGMWLRNNSIHHSLARCITVHGTFNTEVSDNVCYIHTGHGYFLEDGVEQFNVLDRNLGVGTEHGALLMSDRRNQWCGALSRYCDGLATFWLTHPNNVVTRNVAGGSDTHGFMYVFANAPLGKSKTSEWITSRVANLSAQYHPITAFDDNVAHSNFKSGVFFDSRMSVGEYEGKDFVEENGVLPVTPNYDPRNPPHANGTSVWTEMRRLTAYRNRLNNLWIKGGNIRITNSSLADSQEGYTGGTIGFISGTEVAHSVFVGMTDNPGTGSTYSDIDLVGTPSVYFNYSYGRSPFDSWTGVSFYQGPMMVTNCHFSRYGHVFWADEWMDSHGFRPVRPGAALSFKRDSIYPSTPWTFVKGLKFDYCDGENDMNTVFRGNGSTYGWGERDGSKANTFHDVDGSLTGHPQSQVVLDRPFYLGPECVYRPAWHMSVCPYKYIQMEVFGNDGVLHRTRRDKSPLKVTRDDQPDDVMDLEGTQKNTFLLRTHKSYTVNFNNELSTVPKFFDMKAHGIEKGDVVRVALCLPKDTTQFQIRSDHPPINATLPPVFASSLEELDNDVTGNMFFWHSRSGLFYFKLMTNETRQNLTELCANAKCVRYKITRLDGGSGPTYCRPSNTPAMQDLSPAQFAVPSPKPCTGPDSNEGLGAIPTDVVDTEPFVITCPSLHPEENRADPEYRGCYKDKGSYNDVPHEITTLSNAMTRDWCQLRCFNRGYKYAALSVGKRCQCGQVFGLYDTLSSDKCAALCPGNRNTTCGGLAKIEVYTTGMASGQGPTHCGPKGNGEVVEGRCLYLHASPVNVGQAQRLCARLGGDLVTIGSQEKQLAVEYYLRDKKMTGKVWSGLNHVRDANQWVHMDGTSLEAFSFWKGTNGDDLTKHFVYLSGTDAYGWVQTKDSASVVAAALCDLPMPVVSNNAESCGTGGKGRRSGGSGTCYMVLHDRMSQQEATYACRLSGGWLATYTDIDSEIALGQVLYRMGVGQSYWTDKLNRVLTWANSMYLSEKVTKAYLAGAVCILDDTVNSTHRCSMGWSEQGDSCYLTLGTVVKSYSEGSALCEMEHGESHVVRVDSEVENSYLTTLIDPQSTSTSHVMLDLFYSSRVDSFIRPDGQTPSFNGWGADQGVLNLVNGSCAVMDTQLTSASGGMWVNAACGSMLANLVCEMAAFAQ